MAARTALPKLHAHSVIGIVNRGEAALRFIRGVAEYNARFGTSLKTAAIYTAKEEHAPFVKLADRRISFEELSGFPGTASSPYLDHELILEALETAGCDALWVGWGFVSEDAPFAEKAEAKGLVFLGPSSGAMALLGDKIAAKDLAESSDVPILPWSKGAVENLKDAEKISDEIGYPVIVKASNAGGGRGIRFVLTPDELAAQYQSAVDETLRITGTRTVFIEHLVRRGRHLEVQVLADRHGNVNTFGVRDCSLQRRNQKIIEETPPPGLKDEQIAEMEAAAARLIKAAEYTGAGTVEYLYDLDSGRFYFMEVNTRLQVEHPITEELFGIDLVTGQIEVAFDREVDLSSASARGHVMEARLNAEDPDNEFSPAPGLVELFRPPAGPGIRVDSGIEAGAEIPPEFDSMVAKIIARGRDRKEASSRLKRALDECTIRIENGTTNRSFLRNLLDEEPVATGAVSTAYVGELIKSGMRRSPEALLRAALMAGAVTIARERYEEGRLNFLNELASIGKPRSLPLGRGQEFVLSVKGAAYQIAVFHVGGKRYHLGIDGVFQHCSYDCSGDEGILEYQNQRYRFLLVPRGDSLQCEVNGLPFLLEQESQGFVKSPSPAIVLSIPVKEGDEVRKGDVLLVLEAMKMEMLIEAPADGRVAELLVGPGAQVAAGGALLRLEESGDQPAEELEEPEKVSFVPEEEGSQASRAQQERVLHELRALFLGFDTGDSPQDLVERLKALVASQKMPEPFLADLCRESLENLCAVETLFSDAEIENEEGGRPHTFTELLAHYALRRRDREKGLPQLFIDSIERALGAYRRAGINDGTDQLLYNLYRSHAGRNAKAQVMRELLQYLEETGGSESLDGTFSNLVNETVRLIQKWDPKLADAALHARYQLIDTRQLNQLRDRQRRSVEALVSAMQAGKIAREDDRIASFLDAPPSVLLDLMGYHRQKGKDSGASLAELVASYLNRDRELTGVENISGADFSGCRIAYRDEEGAARESLVLISSRDGALELNGRKLPPPKSDTPREVILLAPGRIDAEKQLQSAAGLEADLFAIGSYPEDELPSYATFHREKGTWVLRQDSLHFSPLEFRELRIDRLRDFELKALSRSANVTVLEGRARENKKDLRLFALASTSEIDPKLSVHQDLTRMVRIEQAYMEAVYGIRAAQQRYPYRLQWNRIIIYNRSLLGLRLMQLREFGLNLVPRAIGLGLEKMVVYSRRKRWREERIREHELIFQNVTEDQFTLRSRRPSTVPLTTLDTYGTKVVRARQRGQLYPYELIKMITHAGFPLFEGLPRGEFEEYDIEIDAEGGSRAVSVKGREAGANESNVVFGLIINKEPETGISYRRVLILADPTRDLGSLAEPECRRINAALDLAEAEKLPVEWLPVSSGAKITMESGTENLDWTAATLKRIIEFTQGGGEINIIVQSINVGAQSYWNAEATMLMHTRGLLIMTDEASLLLTGKRALDFSGSVSGETNVDIGGAEKIMLPNGQAQIRTKSLAEAYAILFRHYRLSYTIPGERFPRRRDTEDDDKRDITSVEYRDTLAQGFSRIGDIFSKELNPDRKKPYDMRQVMRALIDTDAEILERWRSLQDGDTSLVWETRLGGEAVGMIGIESRNFARIGAVPPDGPDTWSGGTLYPNSSRKVARGLNAFSGRLPAVIVANLSGFDGSPESLRRLQLEYGAEIGRAVVNFKGPLVFLVTARYHGGAYVVFSKRLNPNLEVAALEGSFASVIGGAPAAAVVFPKEVRQRTEADERIVSGRDKLKREEIEQKEFEQLYQAVYNEHQTALGAEFDRIHSVERAREVGSIDHIIPPAKMRPYLIDAVRRGMARVE